MSALLLVAAVMAWAAAVVAKKRAPEPATVPVPVPANEGTEDE